MIPKLGSMGVFSYGILWSNFVIATSAEEGKLLGKSTKKSRLVKISRLMIFFQKWVALN